MLCAWLACFRAVEQSAVVAALVRRPTLDRRGVAAQVGGVICSASRGRWWALLPEHYRVSNKVPNITV